MGRASLYFVCVVFVHGARKQNVFKRQAAKWQNSCAHITIYTIHEMLGVYAVRRSCCHVHHERTNEQHRKHSLIVYYVYVSSRCEESSSPSINCCRETMERKYIVYVACAGPLLEISAPSAHIFFCSIEIIYYNFFLIPFNM